MAKTGNNENDIRKLNTNTYRKDRSIQQEYNPDKYYSENLNQDNTVNVIQNKNPPFEITNPIITLVAEIGELIGKLTATQGLSMNPTLRRSNRIRTIHASLAIEQNTLSIEQVTAVLSGKRVIAPPKDIAEVQNAYEIYEHMDTMDPFSVDSLLNAHGVMMRGLNHEAGEFRSGSVGVVDQSGEILHFGSLPRVVPDLVVQLLKWTSDTDLHMLIRSCVFHYEFEVIHPFSDGNGRMGRLWHTLLLSKWNPVFAWLPVETIIHDRQREYYEAINASNNAADGTIFVEFMLAAIKASLIETIETSDEMSDAPISKQASRQNIIETFLKQHPSIMNADVRILCGVSAATANRILAGLVANGMLEKYREGGHWMYRLTV